jgi:hypothetical protein
MGTGLVAVKSGFILFIKSYQFPLQINTLERERERERVSLCSLRFEFESPTLSRRSVGKLTKRTNELLHIHRESERFYSIWKDNEL